MFKTLVYCNLNLLKYNTKIFVRNFNKFKFFYQADLENSSDLNYTGFFFKKLALLNMGLATLNNEKHKKLTIKSTVNSL